MSCHPLLILETLREAGIKFFSGVPDSLLAPFCGALAEHVTPDRHMVATDEGVAVALAMGWHMATGEIPLVYLQNSGLGNAINPLVSLADARVLGVPLVLLIGWRGESNETGAAPKDEPQHVVQGRITLPQLDLLGIEWRVLDADIDIKAAIHELTAIARAQRQPVALVARRGSFGAMPMFPPDTPGILGRAIAISAIAGALPPASAVVATTGMAARELAAWRHRVGSCGLSDLLCVGGMGLAGALALGVSQAQPERLVCCIDGDGAALMHMGSLSMIAKAPNLLHVILQNGTHASVGAQPTANPDFDFPGMGKICGYSQVRRVHDLPALQTAMIDLLARPGSRMLVVHCGSAADPDLARPGVTPSTNRKNFMGFLGASKCDV